MAITNWPKEDRPREKLLKKGAKELTDAELLAIFINTGIKGKTSLDIAKELLVEYGSLKSFLAADSNELMTRKGLGVAKLALIKAVGEIGLRSLYDTVSVGETLKNPLAAKNLVISKLAQHQQEVFACLFLTSQQRLISFEEMFFGTINEANVYPREVVKRALKLNAAKIIVAHNHPSGNLQPSTADLDITIALKKALALVDITLMDHIIVTEKEAFSFSERGCLI